LKIRDDTFVTETRQVTLPKPTDDHRDIHHAACRLLAAVETDGRRFRLTGVSVANFESRPPAVQLDLLAPAAAPRGEAVQAVLSAVRERFGHQALFPADAGAERRPNTTGAITRSHERRARPKS
jgi:DNA polymerase-4